MKTVIGCGNLDRSDDGVGVVVAQRLHAAFEDAGIKDVQAIDTGTAGMEVMFRARGSVSLIVVDACASGSEPGAVFHVPGTELEALPERKLSLHDFRWQHALHAGRLLFRDAFSRSVEAYLVEVANVGLGVGLSEEVEVAADTVVDLIFERVAATAQSA